MKKLMVIVLVASFVLGFGVTVYAQNPNPYNFRVKSMQVMRIVTGSGVSDFTVPVQTAEAIVTVEGGNVRFTMDGTDPGPQYGHKIVDGTSWALKSPYQVKDGKVTIDSASTGATVTVTYFGN